MKRNRFIPYGYCMAKGEISIHPQEGCVVSGIFERYLQGVSPAKMADDLNDQRVRFSESNPNWNKNRIYRILTDERYTGSDQYPKIIDEKLLRAAEEKIEHNSTYKAPSDMLARSVGGLLRCNCGDRPKRNATMRWVCQRCGEAITSLALERELMAIMNRLCIDSSLAERVRVSPFEPTSEIMRLNSEIRRAINSKDFDAAELREKVLRCASLKYDAFQDDTSPYIRGVIEKGCKADSVAAVVGKTVDEIVVESPDRLRIKLKNGAIIRTIKEDSNGNSDE